MSITFYPTVSKGEMGRYADIPRALIPCSSWAGAKLTKGSDAMLTGDIPPVYLHPAMREVAADCGGFVATKVWGKYRYSHEQYVRWLSTMKQYTGELDERGCFVKSYRTFTPSWAAVMDYCCEDEITSGNAGIVRQRQEATTANVRLFWSLYRDCPWVWVPTIQGWTIADYVRHATELKPLIEEMEAHYGPDSAFRVGIGTLCHRASTGMIQAVVAEVARVLPSAHFHLWGIKRSTFASRIALPSQVVSTDSAAFNGLFGDGRTKWKESGLSQRRYTFEIALVEYEQAIARDLATPKMDSLFSGCEEEIA